MKSVNSIDTSNMRQVILDFPKQFREGITVVERLRIGKLKIRTPIVICGMGGSASVGDIVKLWLRNEYLGVSEFEVLVHRGYGLPKLERKDAGWEPLIIVISYSGNTEEALSAYETAKAKRLPLVVIATGGELKKRATADKTLFVQIPETHIQPRSSFGYQFGSLVALLAELEVLQREPAVLAALEKTLNAAKLEAAGKRIAKKLVGRIPLVYASDAWRELAYIIKIKCNEHAKSPAFWNYFPELNHNEMVGFDAKNTKHKAQNTNFYLLLLEAKNDHPRIQKRMRLTAKLLNERGIESTRIPIEGRTVLEKIFSTLLLGDWIAYWHAMLRGIDPSPVEMVEKFKKLME